MGRARSKQASIVALHVAAIDDDAEVTSAAKDAIKSIESWLAVAANFQNVWYGLSLGSVLLLAAIGLAITFGVMGVIKMAHGEMAMFGAYTTFVVQEAFRAYAPGAFNTPVNPDPAEICAWVESCGFCLSEINDYHVPDTSSTDRPHGPFDQIAEALTTGSKRTDKRCQCGRTTPRTT